MQCNNFCAVPGTSSAVYTHSTLQPRNVAAATHLL